MGRVWVANRVEGEREKVRMRIWLPNGQAGEIS